MGAHENIRLNRRKVIHLMGWLALIPIAGLWDLMIKRNQARDESRSVSILLSDIPRGSSFYNEYWINKEIDEIKIFSTRCTHLGCLIRPAADGQLICPCHGSSFDPENGTIIKGPAGKDLEKLDYIIEDDHITIYLK